MTTARERMKALSGLLGPHSAREHFQAITQGTGTGVDRLVFASQMTVCVEAPCLTLIQQPAFSSSRGPSETTTATQQRGKANNITVWTRLARVDVETRPSSTFVVQKLVTSCFVRTLPNTMVTQHDRSVAHI